MEELHLDLERLYIWKYGMPAPEFWLRNMDLIADLVKRNNIPRIDRSYFMAPLTEAMASALPEMADIPEAKPSVQHKEMVTIKPMVYRKYWPRPFPGGLKIPHVHLSGEVYILKDEHWKEFTKTIITGFKEKLNNAGNVNFEQAMKLADAFNSLG